MYTYSKKSRRRMHAIPAAIALSIVTFLWLVLGGRQAKAEPTETQFLLNSEHLKHWQQDCTQCIFEAQYDVMVGNVVRLQSRHEMVLSRALTLPQTTEAEQPLLNWRWTVDRFVEANTLMRLTVRAENGDGKDNILHYVWDSGRSIGSSEMHSGHEYSMVVSGQSSAAEQWQYASAPLAADWQRFFQQPLPAQAKLELALGMPGKLAIGGGFIEQLSIASVPVLKTSVADQHTRRVNKVLSRAPTAAGKSQ